EGKRDAFPVAGATGTAQVRLVNALTSSTAVNFAIDGQVVASGIVFGGASPYISVSAGSHRMQAIASGTGTSLVDFTRDVPASGAFSMIPAPGLSQFGALFL